MFYMFVHSNPHNTPQPTSHPPHPLQSHDTTRCHDRSYGALVGKNKKECVAQHGAEQVWRYSDRQTPRHRLYVLLACLIAGRSVFGRTPTHTHIQ